MPADSDEDPQYADGNRTSSASPHHQHLSQQRIGGLTATLDRRGGVEEAHRAAALFNIKPVVDHRPGAAGFIGASLRPRTDTHQHELDKKPAPSRRPHGTAAKKHYPARRMMRRPLIQQRPAELEAMPA